MAEYRTYTRNLDVDAALVQLKTLEKEANRSPQDPFSQEKYLRVGFLSGAPNFDAGTISFGLRL